MEVKIAHGLIAQVYLINEFINRELGFYVVALIKCCKDLDHRVL